MEKIPKERYLHLLLAEIARSDSVGIKVYTIGVGTKGMAKSPVAFRF